MLHWFFYRIYLLQFGCLLHTDKFVVHELQFATEALKQAPLGDRKYFQGDVYVLGSPGQIEVISLQRLSDTTRGKVSRSRYKSFAVAHLLDETRSRSIDETRSLSQAYNIFCCPRKLFTKLTMSHRLRKPCRMYT